MKSFNLLQNRRGVSAIEYAIIAAVVLVAVGAGAALLGPQISAKFTAAESAMK